MCSQIRLESVQKYKFPGRSNNCWKSTSDLQRKQIFPAECLLRPEEYHLPSSCSFVLLHELPEAEGHCDIRQNREWPRAAKTHVETYRIRNCPGQEKLKSICFSILARTQVWKRMQAELCHSCLCVCSCVYVTRQRFLWGQFKFKSKHFTVMMAKLSLHLQAAAAPLLWGRQDGCSPTIHRVRIQQKEDWVKPRCKSQLMSHGRGLTL